MNMKCSFVLLVCLSVFVLSCDDSVSPYGPFEPRLTVYALLNTNSDVQIIRVYSSFDISLDPAGGKAPDTLLNDATIRLSQGNNTFALRDTVIFRNDLHLYKGDIAAKVASFAPEFGKTYTITVQSPSLGSVTATATVPSQSSMTVFGLYSILFPEYYNSAMLRMNVTTSSKGFVLRMFVDYEVFINDIWFPKQDEVPRNFITLDDGTSIPSFAQLELSTGKLDQLWSLKTLAYSISSARERYNAYHITFKRVIIEVRQFDEHLFNYYKRVNAFRDPRTIRTDAPDYTNIEGGLGVFGAFTVERLTFDFPPDYVGNQ